MMTARSRIDDDDDDCGDDDESSADDVIVLALCQPWLPRNCRNHYCWPRSARSSSQRLHGCVVARIHIQMHIHFHALCRESSQSVAVQGLERADKRLVLVCEQIAALARSGANVEHVAAAWSELHRRIGALAVLADLRPPTELSSHPS
jgi:hypothetical protein